MWCSNMADSRVKTYKRGRQRTMREVKVCAVQAKECSVCKSLDFDETEDGAYACVECGTQIFGMRAEVNEQSGADAGVTFSTRYRAQVPCVIGMPASETAVTGTGILASVVMEAFQCMLQSFVAALVDQRRGGAGLDMRLAPAVGMLWMRTARIFNAAITAGSRASIATLRLRTVPVVPQEVGSLSLTPRLALAICYLGCLELRLPVLPHDLLAWARDGTLPYFSAHAMLPSRLQCVSDAHGSLDAVVRPRRHATVDQLRRTAGTAADALALPSEPLPDREATLERLCEHFGLSADGETARSAAMLLEAVVLHPVARRSAARHPRMIAFLQQVGKAPPDQVGLADEPIDDVGIDQSVSVADYVGIEDSVRSADAEASSDAASAPGVHPLLFLKANWLEVWRLHVAAVVIAIKFSHDLTGPLTACASHVDIAWARIEVQLLESILHAPLGPVSTAVATVSEATAVAAVSLEACILAPVMTRSVREIFTPGRAQLPSYRRFVSRHVLVGEHPRVELHNEATVISLLANRLDCGSLRAGWAELAPPVPWDVPPVTSLGTAVPSDVNPSGVVGAARTVTASSSWADAAAPTPRPRMPYLTPTDFDLVSAWRSSRIGSCAQGTACAEMSPRYTLLLRGAAALLGDAPTALHKSVLRMECFFFRREAREARRRCSSCAQYSDGPKMSKHTNMRTAFSKPQRSSASNRPQRESHRFIL